MNHIDKIHQALRAVSERNGLECVDNTTPLDSLIDKEEEEVAEEYAIRQEAMHRLLLYIFKDGYHPGNVMRRAYALAWQFDRELIGNMNLTDMAQMFGETRAAASWRIEALFGGLDSRAPGTKTDTHRRRAARSAEGNTNRKKGTK